MSEKKWTTYNSAGSRRVVVTKELPGKRWLEILTQADCQIIICTSPDILTVDEIKTAIRDRCDGVIGQLTEDWGADLSQALRASGAKAYSN